LIESGTKVHHTLKVAHTVNLGHIWRAHTFSKSRHTIECLSAGTIYATRFALIFARTITCFARIVAALAVLLRIPLAILNIISKIWAFTLGTVVLKEFIPIHAL
jgi:hypothetical protein